MEMEIPPRSNEATIALPAAAKIQDNSGSVDLIIVVEGFPRDAWEQVNFPLTEGVTTLHQILYIAEDGSGNDRHCLFNLTLIGKWCIINMVSLNMAHLPHL